MLRARDQGLPVTAVAALVQQPLTSIISLPVAGIDDPSDLAGKTVGTAGIDYQSAFLKAILAEAAVDPASVTERNLGFNLVPGLLTDKADAVLGAFWNYEGEDLKLQGASRRSSAWRTPACPSYDELVVVANEDALERDAADQAVPGRARPRQPGPPARPGGRDRRSWRRQGPRPAPPAGRAQGDPPLLSAPRGKPYGWQEPGLGRVRGLDEREQAAADTTDARGAYTNELLPGAGL